MIQFNHTTAMLFGLLFVLGGLGALVAPRFGREREFGFIFGFFSGVVFLIAYSTIRSIGDWRIWLVLLFLLAGLLGGLFFLMRRMMPSDGRKDGPPR